MTRQVPNGKPAFETSSAVTAATTSRARGPQIPIVVFADVASNSWAEPSVGQVVREPLLVAHAHAAAGHDPEPVVGEPHDREVRDDPAGRVQQRRVDDAPDGHVDVRRRTAAGGTRRRPAR